MLDTRKAILEHLDEDVQRRLRVHRDQALTALSERQEWLLDLTRTELISDAHFDPGVPRFLYTGEMAEHGFYSLEWHKAEEQGDVFYRPEHQLALDLCEQAKNRQLPPTFLVFRYTDDGRNIGALSDFVGRSGWLELDKLTVDSFETEEFLIFNAHSDDGQALDEEQCRKLFTLQATVENCAMPVTTPQLISLREEAMTRQLCNVEKRNTDFFDEEVAKLDLWAEDLKAGLERELKELDREIREARKRSTTAPTLAEKVEAQREIRDLESKRNRKRRELFEAQDAIDRQRDELITGVELKLKLQHKDQILFTIRWRLT
jgi:hypothetical protein